MCSSSQKDKHEVIHKPQKIEVACSEAGPMNTEGGVVTRFEKKKLSDLKYLFFIIFVGRCFADQKTWVSLPREHKRLVEFEAV